MGKRKNNLFWLSYSDLMTSLFFVMLVLFVLVFSIMQHKANKLENQIKQSQKIQNELANANAKLAAKASELDKINEIRKSLENIDKKYFIYNDKYKKHILNIKIKLPTNSHNINDLSENTLKDLNKAGISLKKLMRGLPKKENIKYLLVIEGQASKDNASINDELSYNRAIALRNFWFGKNPDLNNVLPNCEVIIAGSGQYGVPREQPDIPPANQRFLITIIPKIGEINNEK